MDGITVRQETADDFSAIDVVNKSAFPSDAEARFVQNLRRAAAFIPELSLVAEAQNRVVGHILLFVVDLVPASADARKILALAPMAVVPSQSHRGIGSALVRAALKKAGSLGHGGVVVIGHPEFYRRFEFDSASRWGIRCPVPVPEDDVTAIELVNGAFGKGGAIRYPASFIELFARQAA